MASQARAGHEKIIEVLKTISVANGYHNDIKPELVTKRYQDIKALTTFPAISVVRGAWITQFEDERSLYHTWAHYAIVGFVQADADDTNEGKLEEKAEELEEDIREAIYSNLDQMLVDIGALTMQLVAGEPLFPTSQNSGQFEITAVLEYTHEANV